MSRHEHGEKRNVVRRAYGGSRENQPVASVGPAGRPFRHSPGVSGIPNKSSPSSRRRRTWGLAAVIRLPLPASDPARSRWTSARGQGLTAFLQPVRSALRGVSLGWT